MDEVTPLDNDLRPDNLRARISIQAYAAKPDWTTWLFERELASEAGPALGVLFPDPTVRSYDNALRVPSAGVISARRATAHAR